MNKIGRISQIVLFPLLGIFILYLLFKDRNFDELVLSLQHDFNYSWILFSLVLGIMSHITRAVRWQMLITTEGRKPGFVNTFGAVVSGYLANLILPRMGEVSKCGVVSKYENISFIRVAGTVLIERLADLIGMLLMLLLVFVLEYDLLTTLIKKTLDTPSLPAMLKNPIFWIACIAIVAILTYVLKRVQNNFISKLNTVWGKFKDGIQSFNKLENKPLFIFYSALIWVFYFLMLYTAFFSMDDTSSLSMKAGLTILITGSLGMLAPIQGGLGAWHFMVIQTLMLYGVTEESAGNFALVVHSSQNLLVVVMGLMACIVLPLFNRRKKE